MPGTVAPPLCTDSPIARASRELLARLDSLFLQRRKNQAQIAHALAAAKRLDLHKAYGYSSLQALAWDRYQSGKTRTSELIAISLACENLPRIREAFDAGLLDWTKAREICKVATPEDELEWLTLAMNSTAAELRAARRGEPLKAQRILSLTPEQAARFDQALAGAKDGLDLAESGEALLALLEGVGSGEESALGESAIPRVVITVCGTCRLATRDSRDGPLVVEPAVVEAARCSGEVHDLREEENVVTRAIPAKVRRRVLDRDQRRCQVPKCQNRSFLEVHHEDGWKAGHQPTRMLVLCEAHHRQRHEGWLLIEGEAPDFRFRTRTGELLGEAKRGESGGFAHANSASGGVAHANSASSGGVAHANSASGGVAHANSASGGVAHANSASGGVAHANSASGGVAHANSASGGVAHANSVSGGVAHANSAGSSSLELADLALGRLGLGARERRRGLREVLARQGQEGWSAEELVRAVLLAA